MRCPIATNQYGHMTGCEENHCAWWNIQKNECAILTLAKNCNNTKTVKIEKDDWGKDI